jgi:hypothetical protein
MAAVSAPDSATLAGISLAEKMIDKLDPVQILVALALILGIVLLSLVLRKVLGEKSNEQKLKEASINSAIAASNTSEKMHEGQGEELMAIHKRFVTLEDGAKETRIELDTLKANELRMIARIAHLEDALMDIRLHFGNLVLDEANHAANKVTINSINRILDAHSRRKTDV